jgi:hypothetical protein
LNIKLFEKITCSEQRYFRNQYLDPQFAQIVEQLASISLKKRYRENRQLVTDEPVEFEKEPVEVQDFRRYRSL